jgi:hypothetical protein
MHAQDAYDWFRRGYPVAGVKILREAAAAGDVDSQKFLAAVLESGVAAKEGPGVAADPREAFAWYEKAAQTGDQEALKRLGILYAVGRGTPRSPEKAIDAFRRGGIDVDAHARAAEKRGDRKTTAVEAWLIAFNVDLNARVAQYPRDALQRNESGTVILHIHTATRAIEVAGGTAPAGLRDIVRETAARGLILVPPPDEAANPGFEAEFVIVYRIT